MNRFHTVSDKISWAREQLRCANCGSDKDEEIYCKIKRWPEDTDDYSKVYRCSKCGSIETDWARLNRALKYIVDNKIEGLE